MDAVRSASIEVRGVGSGRSAKKNLDHSLKKLWSTWYPVSLGGGAIAMASAGYQKRESAAWSDETESTKEMERGEICPEIAAASLMRARSRTEG